MSSGNSFAGGCLGAMFGIGAICVLCILACGGLVFVGSEAAKQQQTMTDKVANAKVSPGLTMAKFRQVQTGMSRQQVVNILGNQAELLSDSQIAGIKTEMWMWKGAFGENCSVMFQDGAVIQKSQFGLK